MRPIEQDGPEPGVGPVVLYDARAGADLEAPPFCANHATSAQRKKLPEAQMRDCSECKLAMSTNYEQFTVCPPCARKVKRCVVCGESTEPAAPKTRGIGPAHAHVAEAPEEPEAEE